MLKNKKVVIYGAAGYIGSTLTELLLRYEKETDGFEFDVLAVDNNHKQNLDPLLPFTAYSNFRFALGDVTNPEDVKRTIDGADYVVAAAAIVGAPACDRAKALAQSVNVGGAHVIMNHKAPETKLIYTNTGSCYGALGERCTEDSPTGPPSWYGKTKLHAEEVYLSGPNTIAHRYSTAFGVGFSSTRVNLLVNTLCYQAVVDRALTIFEADFKRSFIHVYDIATAIVHTMFNFDDLDHRIYNVGNPTLNMTKRELAHKIADRVFELNETPVYLTFADNGKDPDVRNYEVSSDRFVATGWEPQYDMDGGLDEIIRSIPLMTHWNRYN